MYDETIHSQVILAYSQFCRDLKASEIQNLGIDSRFLRFNERRRLFKVKAAKISWIGTTGMFEFFEAGGTGSQDSQHTTAVIFLCRDECGHPADLAAWSPAEGRLGLWTGHVAMLGQENTLMPRVPEDEALRVWPSPKEWLAADRDGVVVIDPTAALSVLYAASPISVESSTALLLLLEQWKPKLPEIKIRPSAEAQVLEMLEPVCDGSSDIVPGPHMLRGLGAPSF